MAVRTRVQRAIEGPVAEAAKLVAETPHADDHTKLSLQLDGWFRGIAAALEELAVELEVLREEAREARAEPPAEPRAVDAAPSEREAPAGAPEAVPRDESDQDETALAERARAARADAEALRRGES